jgi:hypothetical protein
MLILLKRSFFVFLRFNTLKPNGKRMIYSKKSNASHLRHRYVPIFEPSLKQIILYLFLISSVPSLFAQGGSPDTIPAQEKPDSLLKLVSTPASASDRQEMKSIVSDEPFQQLLDRVAAEAADPARSVLSEGRKMVYQDRGIIRGSCWTFVNEIFRRTGHESDNRTTVFRSGVNGPYADPDMIKAGDWIYHRNYSYRNIPHSAIFIEWVDRDRRIAYTLSYAGEGRRSVARYLKYDLRKVYQIVRPGIGQGL